MDKTRYVMVGGFLGAGKTTAILKLAEKFRSRGLRVGLITNDQSVGLVDTAMLGSNGFDVAEITGGCFCCKFNSLMEAADTLSREARPDVFIAEPVGSCTDLKATVDYPLRRLYGEGYQVAPFSVLIDPVRAMRILGLETGKNFSPKVTYIYLKQLEEADLLVINKTDLLSSEKLRSLEAVLKERFPKARVLRMSARSGEGLEAWLGEIDTAAAATVGAMTVDYDLYAEGEALLGWLNATVEIASDGPFDGNAMIDSIGEALRARLAAEAIEVAHLKMTLTPDEGTDLAVANLVRGDGRMERAYSLQSPTESGELILNLRAEADPELLRRIVLTALEGLTAEGGLRSAVEHIEAFRPGRPTPTHRLANA